MLEKPLCSNAKVAKTQKYLPNFKCVSLNIIHLENFMQRNFCTMDSCVILFLVGTIPYHVNINSVH